VHVRAGRPALAARVVQDVGAKRPVHEGVVTRVRPDFRAHAAHELVLLAREAALLVEAEGDEVLLRAPPRVLQHELLHDRVVVEKRAPDLLERVVLLQVEALDVLLARARRPHEPRAHAGFGCRTRVAGLVPLGAHAGVLHAVGAPATAAQRNWPGRRLDQTGLARAC